MLGVMSLLFAWCAARAKPYAASSRRPATYLDEPETDEADSHEGYTSPNWVAPVQRRW